RKNLLHGRVLIGAVVTTNARQLHFDGPLWPLTYAEVARLAPARITRALCCGPHFRPLGSHLTERQRHRIGFRERADARTVGTTLASVTLCLRPPLIGSA